MADILQAIPGLAGAGAGGILLLLVFYLLKSNRDDRTQHRETLAAINTEHRQDDATAETRIGRLEGRIDELQKTIDTERGLRRDAQERAFLAESRAAAAEAALRRVTGGAHEPATSWLPPPHSISPGPSHPRPDPGAEDTQPRAAGDGGVSGDPDGTTRRP